MPHRILVGVDDSPAARRALERAIQLAAEGNGRLGLLVSAPNAPLVVATSPVVPPASRSQLTDEMVDWAKKCVDAATELVPADVPVTKLVAHGEPCAALRCEVEKGCWDLVVVGESSHFRLRRSVGARLRRRGIPVLVVHEPVLGTGRSRRRKARRAAAPIPAKGV